MSAVSDILTTLVKGFGAPYFIVAAPILIVCGLIWLAVRRRIRSALLRRVLVSLMIALVFAPSIFGFDLGAVTVPALLIMYAALRGGLRSIAFWWSLVSIVTVWFATFGLCCLISVYHGRRTKIAA